MSDAALTVSAVNAQLKAVVEGNPAWQNLVVRGEISNLKRHSSGHVYFTLKDEQSQLSAAFFKMSAMRNGWHGYAEGDAVLAHGSLSVYEARGTYQLIVNRILPAGVGTLFRQLERTKAALAAEGLFDPDRKRSLPRFPHTVALITSLTGAVLQDIRRTLTRRGWPLRLIVLPAQMQGEGALPTLLDALARAQALPGVQVIVFARGGGSLEDLWPFNEDALSRAVAASPIPVLSAIGHETDTTLLDYVADVRASTPTAAAELLSPPVAEIRAWLLDQRQRLDHAFRHQLEQRSLQLDELQTALSRALATQLDRERYRLVPYQAAITGAWQRHMSAHRAELATLSAQLHSLNPEAVLARGYAVVTHNGLPVMQAAQLAPQDTVELQFADGSRSATIG